MVGLREQSFSFLAAGNIAHSGANPDRGLHMTMTPLIRKVLLGAAESSLDVAGAALLPGAWPILKGALHPVLERLKEQLGGDDILGSKDRAEAAATAFEADPHLQECCVAGCSNGSTPWFKARSRSVPMCRS